MMDSPGAPPSVERPHVEVRSGSVRAQMPGQVSGGVLVRVDAHADVEEPSARRAPARDCSPKPTEARCDGAFGFVFCRVHLPLGLEDPIDLVTPEQPTV